MKTDIIVNALKEVGTKESPANSNMQKYGEWYGKNGVAWCAAFVSYIMFKSGVKFPVDVETPKGFIWVPSLYIRAKQNGWITLEPEAGDVVLFDWQGDKQADHVGFFICWLEKGKTFVTVEGNTSIDNDSNGGEVMVRVRNIASVQAFVRV